MNAFDVHVFYAINHLAAVTPYLNPVMVIFAKYAPEMYALLFILGWFMTPRDDANTRQHLVTSALSGIIAIMISTMIGHLYYRPRPFIALPHGSVHQLVSHAPDSSFPSTHASGVFGFASGLWSRRPKLLRYLFTTIAIIVSFSRVYVGVHWPTDVLAGMVIGIASGYIAKMLGKVTWPLTHFGMRLFRMGAQAEVNQTQ